MILEAWVSILFMGYQVHNCFCKMSNVSNTVIHEAAPDCIPGLFLEDFLDMNNPGLKFLILSLR